MYLLSIIFLRRKHENFKFYIVDKCLLNIEEAKHNLCCRVLRNFVKLDLRANVDVTFTIATPSYMFMLPVLQGQMFTSLSLIKIIPKLVFILHDSVIFVVLFFF